MNVHVVAVGARTPLGLTAAPSAAAFRAGINSMTQHPFMVDQVGEEMPAAMDLELDAQLIGPNRFLALAESALRETCQSIGTLEPLAEVAAYVALPEWRPGFERADAEAIRAGLSRLGVLPVMRMAVRVVAGGHAAGLALMSQAAKDIERGSMEACMIGGVESYLHPDTMEWLDGNRQLHGPVSRSAFVPGEGAGFILLMSERRCDRLGLQPLMRMASSGVATEEKRIKSPDLCLGEGLTEAIRTAVAGLGLPSIRVGRILCDINGERYRGEEWGFACLRLSEFFDDPTSYDSPADCWGDLGAASGPLLTMLACESVRRGYSDSARTLLWASSEGGLRAAVILEMMDRN